MGKGLNVIFHGYEHMEYEGELIERMVFGLAHRDGKYDPSAADVYRFANGYIGDTDLDVVYRENQGIDGTERNVQAGVRSLSVGDIICNPQGVFVVAPFGFVKLDKFDREDFHAKFVSDTPIEIDLETR